jgi:hypothetical protein
MNKAKVTVALKQRFDINFLGSAFDRGKFDGRYYFLK